MNGLLLLASLVLGQTLVPEIVMEDQFENRHHTRDHRGEVLVLIYGDRSSATANGKLGEQLHVEFHPQARGKSPAEAQRVPVRPVPGLAAGKASPEVRTVPVACIGKVPSLVARLIRSQIRSASPVVPVWLDLGDTMKTMFPFKPGVPNVVVLDTQGRHRYSAAGQPTAEGIKKLIDTIEALRREAK